MDCEATVNAVRHAVHAQTNQHPNKQERKQYPLLRRRGRRPNNKKIELSINETHLHHDSSHVKLSLVIAEQRL